MNLDLPPQGVPVHQVQYIWGKGVVAEKVIGTFNSSSAMAKAKRHLAALMALLCSTAVGAHDELPATVERVAPSIVRIAIDVAANVDDIADKSWPSPPKPSGVLPAGSGLIVDAAGYVLTTAHLIPVGGRVLVRLMDGREFPAALIGSDKRTDIAILKIEASGLSAARLGDARKLRLGERVFALGALPANVAIHVANGIVGAISAPDMVPGFISSTVPPGFMKSGSTLFNMTGEAVGINAVISLRTTGQSSVFAIPINDAMRVGGEMRRRAAEPSP